MYPNIDIKVAPLPPPSEEVQAYPHLLKLLKIDFLECALNEADDQRRVALALLACLKDDILDDGRVCESIEIREGLADAARPLTLAVSEMAARESKPVCPRPF